MLIRALSRLRGWDLARRRSLVIAAAVLALGGAVSGVGLAAASSAPASDASSQSVVAPASDASSQSLVAPPASASPSPTAASPAPSSTPTTTASNVQSITVPCPASVQVTPALNANLISDPGAESTTPYPASYGLPAGSSFESEPDCWTIASQSAVLGGILSAVPYTVVNWSTSDPNKGNNLFFGGNGVPAGPLVTGTSATQTIDLSSLNAAGQPFLLSAYIGGQNDETDVAEVSVSFEDASGNVVTGGGPFQIGPVTPAMLCNTSALLPEETSGVVPAGATQAVVVLSTQAFPVPAGDFSDNAVADSLNLTVGPAATTSGSMVPTLTCLNYTATGPGGGLDRPVGISAADGTVYVSNTAANVVAALADGNTTAVAGSLKAFGEHGDGGRAASASLYQPGGIAVDSAGNLYIADTGDNVIREVNARTGVISRLAGTGVSGNAGLGGPATRAELDAPAAVAVNAAGDVFVSDTNSNRVDEVLPSGLIVPFAGNGIAGYKGDGHQAKGAELRQPTGLAIDSAGNVYIADSGNNVIRRVDAKTGNITTVAGDYAADQANAGLGGYSGDGGPATSAQLNDPQGIAFDGAGDLFIADTFNNAIREVTPAGTITTVVNAGSGGIPPAGGEKFGPAADSQLNTPGAITVDQSTDVLYIADSHNNSIAMVTGLARPGDASGPTIPASS